MQIPRPPAAGDPYVVRHLRTVLFSEPILGAASVRPKGLLKARILAVLLGWAGPLLVRRATEPLPPTTIYLAATAADLRLFAKPVFGDAFEIGRWKKGSYRASANGRRLVLQLERLGTATVFAGASARAVFDLVVAGAAGPAI